MITLRKLDIANADEVSFVEKLYINSFPYSERRTFSTMIDMHKNSPMFNMLLAEKENQSIGLLTYWEFNDFIFAEYFAIATESRNGGIGAKVMTSFMQLHTKPIILEVELPTTILAERRIGFYQRLGYKLWTKFSYQQPPYHADSNPVPMYLMTWGEIDLDKNFATTKDQIYSEAYNC